MNGVGDIPGGGFNADHLGEFSNAVARVLKHDRDDTDKPKIDAVGKRSVASYAKHLHHINAPGFPNNPEKRSAILARASADDTIETVCASILAWGAMRSTSFGQIFSEDRTRNWLCLAQDIRNGGYTRKQAYQAFLDIRAHTAGPMQKSKLLGMRPAYFTKLIHFLMPRDDPNRPVGYILDQWAGWSVNMLSKNMASNQPIVRMDETYAFSESKKNGVRIGVTLSVSDLTCADQYESFCQNVDELVAYFSAAVSEYDTDKGNVIDCAFMSGDRNNVTSWRGYLVQQQKRLRGING